MTYDRQKRAVEILKTPALLKQLASNVRENPAMLEAMLSEIIDPNVREQMRQAIAAENAR